MNRLLSWLLMVLLFAGLLAAEATTKIDTAAKALEDFLGGEGRIIRNADGDTILMRGDKKIRFDINDPHGDNPHFHLERNRPVKPWGARGASSSGSSSGSVPECRK